MGKLSAFDAETAVTANTSAAGGGWSAQLSSAWNIGDHSNGGYALTPVLRAMRTFTDDKPDPVTVTAHFLRPVSGDAEAQVSASLVRGGRKLTVTRGELRQRGRLRMSVIAAFGRLGDGRGRVEVSERPPAIPPAERCVHRGLLKQGVGVPLMSRVDMRVRPEHAEPGSSDRALLDGWVRLADGAAPSTLSLPFFADAFPPSLFTRFGLVGWVPSVELTVHVRRVPAGGWLQGRFESHDISGGRVIESGILWDSAGQLVAHSRQLCLLLSRGV